MANSVEIPLEVNGTALTLTQIKELFSCVPSAYSERRTGDRGQVFVEEFVGHVFNQTLQRDMFFGAWAEVTRKSHGGEGFLVRLTSPDPHADLSVYEQKIPEFLAAGTIGLSIFREHSAAMSAGNCRFLLPLGLSMAGTRSLQLLHFPHTSAITYQDHLFSGTIRRWESLLQYNSFDCTHTGLVERVVDIVPVAAPGNTADSISPFDESFADYAIAMLRATLNRVEFDRDAYQWYDRNSYTAESRTQPVVAYGRPVHDWIERNMGQMALSVNSVVTVQLFGPQGPTTPVLTANHPGDFMSGWTGQRFDPRTTEDVARREQIMFQDLISAGWQKQMSELPYMDPEYVLEQCTRFWSEQRDVVREYAQQQMTEFHDFDGAPVRIEPV